MKQFVLSHRKDKAATSAETPIDALQMPNTFPARERRFISELAEDLHLDVSWDEYDDEDQNLVVFRLPGVARAAQNENDGVVADDEEDDGNDDDWVDESDESDDPEAVAAVDRVLKKYESARVVEEEEDDFDARHARAVQDKMDDWKRSYYRVRTHLQDAKCN